MLETKAILFGWEAGSLLPVSRNANEYGVNLLKPRDVNDLAFSHSFVGFRAVASVF
jgi:hypothetical protein